MKVAHVSLLVPDYDEAIRFFVEVLGFDLIEDTVTTSDTTGGEKRFVVVRPAEAETGIVLARAETAAQEAAIGNQLGGRVGFFLHTSDFAADHARMTAAGVRFREEPRHEPYGIVAVWEDPWGNPWDLLQPATTGV